MLTLSNKWVWDFWLVETETEYHAFYLQAPREIKANDRHLNTSVGHAVSTDLTTWDVLGDALTSSAGPAFDDFAIWTGSVVRGDDGSWHMFYTGLSQADGGQVQRIGVATSTDLHSWTRRGTQALVTSDARWYDQFAVSGRPEAWRDPWVIRDPDGDGWHMLVTAAGRDIEQGQQGVLGHARSTDLVSWEVQPPLSAPRSGFAQLEVPQLAVVDAEPVLLFNCLGPELPASRRESGESGGVWVLRPESLLGPYDVARATRLTDESLYVGKLIQRRDGRWVLLAFVNQDADGAFVGSISDPIPVELPVGSGPLLSALGTPS
jgi:beta-fructofuranosidase